MESVKRANRAMNTNRAYFHTLRMILALSIWHEFTHGFVTFLAGPKRARTPPECDPGFNKSAQSAGDQPTASMRGESGDFLECEVWGGAIQMDDVADPGAASKPVRLPSIMLMLTAVDISIIPTLLSANLIHSPETPLLKMLLGRRDPCLVPWSRHSLEIPGVC